MMNEKTYMGQISEEIQQVIRSGTFFCFSIINFGHLESLKDKTKITSRSVIECGTRI